MRFISKRILEKFISVFNKDTWACDIIISSFQGRGVALCCYLHEIWAGQGVLPYYIYIFTDFNNCRIANRYILFSVGSNF
jgi:hypothetical protein